MCSTACARPDLSRSITTKRHYSYLIRYRHPLDRRCKFHLLKGYLASTAGHTMAVCLHSLKYEPTSTPLEGVDLHKLTYTLLYLGSSFILRDIDCQSEETSSPDLKQLHSGNFTRMPYSVRASRRQSTQSSPTSGDSTFSFSSFWSSFSKSPRRSTLTLDTEVSSNATSEFQSGVNCKLVWGISGKNFKPGLLFTRQVPDGWPAAGQLLLLQMGKSFKTQCIDEPKSVIQTLLRNFCYARSVTPSTSRFAATLTDENYDHLAELELDAKYWEECGEMDSNILAKGPVLQEIKGDMLRRLLSQPNIFHILGKAAAIFTCTELGIPSPHRSTTASSLDSSPVLASKNGLFTMTSAGDDWLYLEKHTYHATLQTCLDDLLPHDSILSLPVETLQALIDGMTESQLLLNVWFSPYQKNGEVDEITIESIASAIAQLDKNGSTTVNERDELIHAGRVATDNWLRNAANLRCIEHDFNVWNLALQRCEKMKTSHKL